MSVSCQCCVLCMYRTLRRDDPSFRGVLPSECVCVCVCVSLKEIKYNNHPLYTYSEWLEKVGKKNSVVIFNKTKMSVYKAYKQIELNFHQGNKQ